MHAQIDAIIQLALTEDIGTGDLSAEHVVSPSSRASGVMIAKAAGVLSGISVAGRVFEVMDPAIRWTPEAADGEEVTSGQAIGQVDGPARSILTAERTALNFI